MPVRTTGDRPPLSRAFFRPAEGRGSSTPPTRLGLGGPSRGERPGGAEPRLGRARPPRHPGAAPPAPAPSRIPVRAALPPATGRRRRRPMLLRARPAAAARWEPRCGHGPAGERSGAEQAATPPRAAPGASRPRRSVTSRPRPCGGPRARPVCQRLKAPALGEASPRGAASKCDGGAGRRQDALGPAAWFRLCFVAWVNKALNAGLVC